MNGISILENLGDHGCGNGDSRCLVSLSIRERRRFVDELVQNGVIKDAPTGWAFVAEVYANAMAMHELRKIERVLHHG
jgi:hypothetical protein